jgi:hypothetical protein
MTICKTAAETPISFRSVNFGAVFLEVGSEEAFMKLDMSYDIEGEDYNAVGLRDGQLVHFGDTERVILPKKDPKLVLEY